MSPRVALVLLPAETVAVKLLTGRAFRAPSPTELAGAHTFSLASNIEQLEPETVTTSEIETEWRAARWLTLRADVFYTEFENQIAYSAANFNLSTNLYTTETSGLEAELLLTRGRVTGFANYTWARREDEEIIDTTIAQSPDDVAWAPARVGNAGAGWTGERWAAAFTLHWQGTTERRASDVGVQTLPLNVVALDMDLYRPREVDSWTSVDARVSRALPHGFTLALDREQSLRRGARAGQSAALPLRLPAGDPALARLVALRRLAWVRADRRQLAACVSVVSATLTEPSTEPAAERARDATPAAASRPDLTQMLRADSIGARHESDGGGRAWLESQEPAVIHAGERGRWTFLYEAGPLGIAAGGMILLQVSPFWGWSTPQVEDPSQPGFTTVALELAPRRSRARRRVAPAAPTLEPTPAAPPDPRAIDARPPAPRHPRRRRWAARRRSRAHRLRRERSAGGGRPLRRAAQPVLDRRRRRRRRPARAAGRTRRRSTLPPGPPAIVVAHLPSAAAPGSMVPLTIAVLDAAGSAGVEFAGTLELSTADQGHRAAGRR